MNNLLVSISCITYNHASYIRECLDGFLMQQCNFSFEVLIHDDASTDGTQEIIKEYQEKYPDIIKPIFQVENQYSKGLRGVMARFNFPRAQGKYIALCEGDDYWTDPLKLQRQVDFMEANEGYSFCGTNFNTLKNNTFYYKTVSPPEITISNIFIKNRCATATLIFRKEVVKSITRVDFKNLPAGDWFIQAFACVYFNPGYVLPIDTAVYRIHGTGMWSQLNKVDMGMKGIKVLKKFKKIFRNKEILREIDKAISLRKKEFGILPKHLLIDCLVEFKKKIFDKSYYFL